MKKAKSIMWGVALIVIGFICGLKALDIIKFDIFFKGWWTLLIIIPSFIGMFDDDDKIGNFIGIIVGVVLLLGVNDVISLKVIWKLMIPLVLITIGAVCLYKNSRMNKVTSKVKKVGDISVYNTTFSGQKIKVDDKFMGAEINATFGGAEFDLRDAEIKDDVVIKVSCIFGGVDLILPNNYHVKVTSNSMFGGVDNKYKEDKVPEKAKTIYINANCVFGGVEVK